MDFLLPLSVLLLLLLLRPTVAAHEKQDIEPRRGRPTKSSPSWSPFRRRSPRSNRSTPHTISVGGGEDRGVFDSVSSQFFLVNEKELSGSRHSLPNDLVRSWSECVYVTSEEGVYEHRSEDSSDAVCGIYLFADADKVIEVHFEEMDVPCESGGLVTFFDGWELNGKFFPGVEDHEKPFGERYQEFCGRDRARKVFTTTQNAGMIHYRVPAKAKGFTFQLTFNRNLAPCNILVESKEDFYTLRNHGRATNCTLIAVFPAKIKVLALDVGVVTPALETGTIYQCEQKRMTDVLQIGGSEDLDSSRIVLFEDVCGLDSSPGMEEVVVGCGVSVVRLVSSGHFENSATVSISQPEEIELLQSTFSCGL